LRARRARLKLASRKNRLDQGEGVFVSGSPTRITPRENGPRYDELASGATVYAYVSGNPLSYVDPLGLAPGNGGERGWSGGAGGTNNPAKHWKDDPANPGWGWQKNPQTGKKTYKKRPPYICPPADEGGNQKMDPFEDALQPDYPSNYAPSPATQTITVGGILVIVVIVLLAPVGA
jgi:hypothetical protein